MNIEDINYHAEVNKRKINAKKLMKNSIITRLDNNLDDDIIYHKSVLERKENAKKYMKNVSRVINNEINLTGGEMIGLKNPKLKNK